MKTQTYPVWARVGMLGQLTKNDIKQLMASPETAFPKLLNENKFHVEGETYFPDEADENINAFGENIEIGFDILKDIEITATNVTTKHPCHDNPNFEVTYNADILSLSNNTLGDARYEEIADDIHLEFNKVYNIVTGIMIMDFRKHLKTHRTVLNDLPYPIIVNAINQFCKEHQLEGF